jgi:hypothetical protein
MSLEIKSMAVLKQFGILFVLGSAGIAMVTITSVSLVEQQLAKLSPEMLANVPPLWVLMLLQGLQLTVLLAIGILTGIGCADRVGLRSHSIDHWVFHIAKSPSFAVEIEWSLGVGASAAIVILLLDRLMQPVLPEALRAANNTEPNWLSLLTAMLYGGITEEILMRWGLMSLLVWIAWKVLKQGITLPSRGIYQRVVPGHTFKYVAALQAAEIGDKPRLARIETRTRHKAGKPTDKIVEETADLWAFAAHWTGLDVGSGK